MKIAIISDAIYPYNKGGKEKRIYEISVRLARLGHGVNIYCMKWWSENSNKKVEYGVTLHAISKYFPLYKANRRSIKQAILFSLSCFKLLNEDFDIIEADHMPHLVLFPIWIVSRLKRKKMVVTWNEVWGRKYWVEYMGLLGNISSLVEWLSFFVPDIIVAVSTHTEKKLHGINNLHKKIITIPNGIDLTYMESVKKSKIRSDVIFAGRLLPHKNVDMLIRSIKILKEKIPNISCTIVGEGPEIKSLLQLTAELNLEKNIRFLNFLPNHRNLYSLMKSAKTLALLSTREGFGIVALEANACGIPVVTVNHADNAVKDLIDGKNGICVDLNEEDVAHALYGILTASKHEEACKKAARGFDWSTITKQVEYLYTKNT